MTYTCPCSREFESIDPGVKYRNRTSDNDGDVELRCPTCKGWQALDAYAWKASTSPVEENTT